MSAPSSTAARLAFFGMTEAAATPSTTRARVDAAVSGNSTADRGPSLFHRLHGSIPLHPGQELRITSQPARTMPNGTFRRARLVVREWYRKADGSWWTDAHRSGVRINATDVEAFASVVAEAAKHLAGEAKR